MHQAGFCSRDGGVASASELVDVGMARPAVGQAEDGPAASNQTVEIRHDNAHCVNLEHLPGQTATLRRRRFPDVRTINSVDGSPMVRHCERRRKDRPR